MSKRNPPAPVLIGRKPHQPDDRLRGLVKWLRIAGYREDQVAEAMSLDPKTLRKHYREELDNAKARTDAMVASSIVMNAVGGPKHEWQKANMTAAIWYTKTQMGWREPKQEVEHSGAVGVYDPGKLKDLSDEELKALASIVARLAPPSPAPDGSPSGD
jgi:hypothetical protein